MQNIKLNYIPFGRKNIYEVNIMYEIWDKNDNSDVSLFEENFEFESEDELCLFIYLLREFGNKNGELDDKEKERVLKQLNYYYNANYSDEMLLTIYNEGKWFFPCFVNSLVFFGEIKIIHYDSYGRKYLVRIIEDED